MNSGKGAAADAPLNPQISGASGRSMSVRKLISYFLATQGAVQAVNVLCGILVLRFLSVPDFAVYVVLTALQSVSSICADMGLSQAMNTFAARARGDEEQMGKLLSSAGTIRGWLLLLAILITAGFAFVMLRHTADSSVVALAGFAMVCMTARSQQVALLHTSILNAHQDSSALFKAGICAALIRLSLVLAVIPFFPNALAAFVTNVAASITFAVLARHFTESYVRPTVAAVDEQRRAFLAFIYPLVPGAFYFLVQAQISTMILSINGNVSYVAEVGALLRLGQILAFLSLLNAFWVQPTFARIVRPIEFKRRAGRLLIVLTLVAILLVLSSWVWPRAWLFILGEHYSHLSGELPLAVASALVSILGTTLFTLIMALGDTRYQVLHIPIGIAAQLAVVFVLGVDSTRDAIALSAAPQVTYAVLQASILSWQLIRGERRRT
jgi:O-antigen/teichoic acid export membrane protein